ELRDTAAHWRRRVHQQPALPRFGRRLIGKEEIMAGILPDSLGPLSGGLLGGAFGQPQPPSFGDFIHNNSNAIPGYLAGALQGGNLGQSIGRGLQGWQQGQRQDQQQQAPATTYRALAAAGVPDATARAAALSPDVLRAIAPRYFQPRLPQFGVIGQDR